MVEPSILGKETDYNRNKAREAEERTKACLFSWGNQSRADHWQANELCDGVHRDPQTRKFTLNGIFQALRAKEFPVAVRFCDPVDDF